MKNMDERVTERIDEASQGCPTKFKSLFLAEFLL